jgi:predicted nucleic-acid-binding protein
MRAVDTNLLVRLVTQDDIKQTQLVIDFIDSNKFFISKTVLLELEWVLRFSYELSQEKIAYVFEQLLSLKNAVFEDSHAVNEALELFKQGHDFADAMHLVSAFACDDLVTFDKAFHKRAAKSNPIKVSLLK